MLRYMMLSDAELNYAKMNIFAATLTPAYHVGYALLLADTLNQ